MSDNYPSVPLSSNGQPGFVIGDPSKYTAFLGKFNEKMLKFGTPGKELMPIRLGAAPVVPLVMPTSSDTNANGQPLYQFVELQAATGSIADNDYVPPVYGPDCTAASETRLARLLNLYDLANAKYLRDQDALVSYILCECSESSRATLKTYLEWDQALIDKDHKVMMRLISTAHMQGSERAKQTYLNDATKLAQGRTSLDVYIGATRSVMSLVVAAFESVANPGYISTDLLFRSLFLNGLDRVQYERAIYLFNKDHPNGSLNEAMIDMQIFQRDVIGLIPVVASSHVPRALVAAVPPSPQAPVSVAMVANVPQQHNTSRWPSLGPWSPKSSDCEHCWNNGVQSRHDKRPLVSTTYVTVPSLVSHQLLLRLERRRL